MRPRTGTTAAILAVFAWDRTQPAIMLREAVVSVRARTPEAPQAGPGA